MRTLKFFEFFTNAKVMFFLIDSDPYMSITYITCKT